MRAAVLWLVGAAEMQPVGGPLLGKAAFVAVFALLLVWLLVLPMRFIDQEGIRRPWWRNVRFWAVLVTLAQIGVYCYWG